MYYLSSLTLQLLIYFSFSNQKPFDLLEYCSNEDISIMLNDIVKNKISDIFWIWNIRLENKYEEDITEKIINEYYQDKASIDENYSGINYFYQTFGVFAENFMDRHKTKIEDFNTKGLVSDSFWEKIKEYSLIHIYNYNYDKFEKFKHKYLELFKNNKLKSEFSITKKASDIIANTKKYLLKKYKRYNSPNFPEKLFLSSNSRKADLLHSLLYLDLKGYIEFTNLTITKPQNSSERLIFSINIFLTEKLINEKSTNERTILVYKNLKLYTKNYILKSSSQHEYLRYSNLFIFIQQCFIHKNKGISAEDICQALSGKKMIDADKKRLADLKYRAGKLFEKLSSDSDLVPYIKQRSENNKTMFFLITETWEQVKARQKKHSRKNKL